MLVSVTEVLVNEEWKPEEYLKISNHCIWRGCCNDGIIMSLLHTPLIQNNCKVTEKNLYDFLFNPANWFVSVTHHWIVASVIFYDMMTYHTVRDKQKRLQSKEKVIWLPMYRELLSWFRRCVAIWKRDRATDLSSSKRVGISGLWWAVMWLQRLYNLGLDEWRACIDWTSTLSRFV